MEVVADIDINVAAEMVFLGWGIGVVWKFFAIFAADCVRDVADALI